ncbi:Epimerase family protein YfhF [Nymphon striatum]|nr:Epimerase family protein YfhF [Nymphon striatum]
MHHSYIYRPTYDQKKRYQKRDCLNQLDLFLMFLPFLWVFVSLSISAVLAQDPNLDVLEETLEVPNMTSFGDQIYEDNAMSAAEMSEKYANMAVADTMKTKFTATVTEVCQAKGCWMRLKMNDGQETMVRFKDYGFFMPMDIAGKEVTVNGLAFVEEMSVEDQKHYAKDGGLALFEDTSVAILEIGFGTGLNCLITLIEAQKRKLSIAYTGVEAYPVTPEELQELNYISELKADAFEPQFQKMHASTWSETLKPNGVLVTYAAKGSVRRAMLAVGFEVERLPGPPGKREMLRAYQKRIVSNITSFVSASAMGIYPNSLSEFYTEEEQKVDDSFLGDVVAAWEKEIDKLDVFNFSLAKIRIGLVMSAEGGALPEMAKPIRFGVGAAFGSGLQWQSWIHRKDLARMFLFVTEHGLEGIYNGVGPNPISNKKLVKEIARVLNRPLFLPNIPKIVMKTILGEMSYLLFASQRVSSKKIEEEGFIFNYPNIGSALEAIYLKEDDSMAANTSGSKEYTA